MKKAKPKKKRSRGQPTRYKEEYVEQGYDLAAHGYTNKEIAHFFKVQERTLDRWKVKYDDFCRSLKKGKWEFDSGKVVNSLLRRALGYQYKETTQELSKKSDPETGEGKLVTTKVVIKEMAPDPTSMIFWLKCRQPDDWRDKQYNEHNLNPEVLSAILTGLPKDFAEAVRQAIVRIVSPKGS